MGQFMRSNPYEGTKFSVARNQGKHCIFHTPISSVNDTVLFVRIGSDFFIEKSHDFCRQRLQLFPVFDNVRVVFVKEMQGNIVWPSIGIMNIIGVCCPGKIMYVWGIVMPGNFSFFRFGFFTVAVPASNIISIL